MNEIKELREYFTEIKRLGYIGALLGWDQEVNMPNGSVKGRAEQIALIYSLIHKRLKSDKTGKLIKKAEKLSNLNEIDKAMIREAKREYDQATKLPDELVIEIARTSSLATQVWREAREKNNFSLFENLLEKTVELQKEKAERLGTHPDLYSTLIDLYEPGATYEEINDVFTGIKPKLVDFVKQLSEKGEKPDRTILQKHYDGKKQWELSIKIIEKLNFDFNIGRQDKSTHPFTTSLSSMDVRITTRINENDLAECIFGTIHECGHALYEMGFKEEIHDTLLADGCSMGIHESQSRMWENIVGRSMEFWTYWYPTFQEYFPENLKNYPMEEFYRSINVVEPSLIRVNADEVTYGLHIILRFEIEKALIDGKITVKELPEVWNSKMEELLGITPPNDKLGVLQDIHWSGGAIGYFPTYFLGNLYAAQFYKVAKEKIPKLNEDFKKGDFKRLLNFLRENIHQYGKIYLANELIERVTNEKLNPNYFMEYLNDKFKPIYKL